MTTNDAIALVCADLDTLRLRVNELTATLGQADNSAWIGHASRKQLIAEAIRLYANNHVEGK